MESNIPILPVGSTFRGMFMFDYAAGWSTPNILTWANFGFGFFPFLNERAMMSNTQFRQ